jgi:cystathionine gamma-synthase
MDRPMDRQEVAPETLAAQGLGEADPISGGLAPVINLSTNYEQQPDGSYRQGRVYTRADNPTSEHEQMLAALEGGALDGGCVCALFGSGMAAATAVFQSLLPGDHVLVSRVLYWGIRKWLAEFALTWGLDVEFTDTADLDAVAAAIRPGRTRLLWVETPANPMWEITDLAAVCDLAHPAGVRVAVDNTVATPVLTRPFEFGADLVIHSATKYLNGHGDVLAGAVLAAVRVFKRATSLGGVESLIEHRRDSEGPSSPVPGDLLRLSIGIEAPADLIADLTAALDKAPSR